MIWAARLALLAAAAVMVWAGAGLVRTLRVPETPQIADGSGRPEPSEISATATAAASSWQPIFGVPDSVPPPPPPPTAPATPYVLRGLFATDDARWAILSGPAWDGVVQVGDMLPSGERVAAIDAAGVQLEAGGRPRRIAFDETKAIEVSRTEVRVEGADTEPAELRTQGLAPEDLRNMLDQARKIRGRQGPAAE